MTMKQAKTVETEDTTRMEAKLSNKIEMGVSWLAGSVEFHKVWLVLAAEL